MDVKRVSFLGDDTVTDSIITACRDFKAAVRLCIEVSGLERKQVAAEIEISEAHLSRMLADHPGADERHFPINKVQQLMEVCGNVIPVRWIALKNGFGIHRLKSALEQENERLRLELEESKREREIILKVVKELKA